jgi:hypothetical protein
MEERRLTRVKRQMRITWRLWLAMDIVTTKFDKSMGGTCVGECEGDVGAPSASAAAEVSAAAESSPSVSAAAVVGGGDAASLDMRRRWPGDRLPSSTAMPMG